MKIKLTIQHKRGVITKEVEAETVEKAKQDWLHEYINKQCNVLNVYAVPLQVALKKANVSIKHEIISSGKGIFSKKDL